MSDAAATSPSEKSALAAIQCLSKIIDSLPRSIASSENPASALLHDESVARGISHWLRTPGAGAGDDSLCRWLYDTFQTNDPDLQLVILSHAPVLAGVYLSQIASTQPLPGFEAVLLALYAHETVIRGSGRETVMLPNIPSPGVSGHDGKASKAKPPAEASMAILSPAVEPYGTMRSTKRARIVGVALELYYSKIALMPVTSKLAFCEFCVVWAGQEEAKPQITGAASGGVTEENGRKAAGRVPMPWELFQPVVRVLGNCLLNPGSSKELKAASQKAVERLYRRAINDMEAEVILATRSLLRAGKMDDAIAEQNIAAHIDESQLEALRAKAKVK